MVTKQFYFTTFLAIIIGMLPLATVFGKVVYTPSPTGYTSVPGVDKTQSTRTYKGDLLQAKATINGSTATFTLKKKDGSKFQNNGVIVIKYNSYDGSTAISNIRYSGGIYNPTVDLDLDFTSGSKKYVVTIKSGDYFYYTNPITITAKTETALSKPDNSTFSAMHIGKNGFTATWGTVTGATAYNILVKKSTDSNYNNPAFSKTGITTNSVSVTGLDPGTGYQFQIRATNGSVLSEWSSSSTSVYYTKADLTITNGTYFGSTTLTKGKAYTFTATIKNNASVPWKGGIYLKSGSEDIGKQGLSVSAGGSGTVSIPYTPTETGTKSFTLYYSSEDKARGLEISGGNYSNPFSVNIQEGSIPTNINLVLTNANFFGTSILTKGKLFTFTAKVQNIGKERWTGKFYLKSVEDNKNWLDFEETIDAGAVVTLTKNYTPTTIGTFSLGLYYLTNGNSNSAIVDNGAFSNPVRITVAEVPTYTKLATPDPSTFRASNISETSFIASWSAIKNAKYYDVKVRKVGGSYEQADFNGGTMGTSLEITGLQPGTSYQFQVRARNDNSNEKGDWSGSSVINIRTKNVGTVMANLSVFQVSGISNGESLTLGESRHLQISVANNSSAPWEGTLTLKEGTQTLHNWTNFQISKGAAKPVDYIYAPKTTGSKQLTLYYKTKNSSGESPVDAGSSAAPNPIKMNVITDKSIYDGLQLKSAISCPNTLETAKTYTLSAMVINSGNEKWTGTLYIAVDGIEMSSKQVSLAAKYGEAHLTAAWTPQTTGQHEIAVYYQNMNGRIKQLVTSEKYKNPVTVQINNTAVLSEASTVIIRHLTKDVVPKQVVPGSHVYYHFRLLNEKGNQLRGIKLRFKYSNDRGQKRVIESEPSDNQGYAVLSINTGEAYSFGRPGDAILMVCNEAVNENGQVIPTRGDTGSDNVLSLLLYKGTTLQGMTGLENVEKIELTFDLGRNYSAELGWKKNKAKGNFGASITSTFGISFDENGRISEYSVDGGVKASALGELSQGSKLRKLGLDDGTVTKLQGLITPEALKAGINGRIRTGFSTDAPGDAIAHFIMTYAYNYTEGTSRMKDLAVKALRKWYEDKRTDKATASLSWGGNAAFTGKILSNWPGNHWVRPLLMPVIKFAELGVTAGGSFTLEPRKVKETWNSEYDGDRLESLKYEKLSGSSSSLKLEGKFDAKLQVGKLWNSIQTAKKPGDILKIRESDDEKTFPSISYTYDNSVTLKHEEMFDDSDTLQEVSQSIAFSNGHDISANKIKLGNWNPGDYSMGISNKTTLKSVTKGKWAQFLARIGVSDGSESYLQTLLEATGLSKNNPDNYRQQVFKIYPNLARKTIFCSPAEIYNAWKQNYDLPLANLAAITPDPQEYNLKEVFKVQKTVVSEVDLDANVNLYESENKVFKINFKGGVTVGITNFPSEEMYYSLPDRRFFTVVQRPTTDFEKVYDGVMTHLADLFYQAFLAEDPGIEKAWNWVCDKADWVYDKATGLWHKAEEWGENVADQASEWTMRNIVVPAAMHYVDSKTDANARLAMRRHPLLSEKQQVDICRFSFCINQEQANFDPGVGIQTAHHYPAGDLLGLTDQGDTLFVVSEVVNIMAIQNTDTLSHAQHGQFTVEGISGADDLTPFGFPETQPLDVYYSEIGSEIWHYLGPAGTTLQTNKLGAYMMGTSIKNDVVIPTITVEYNKTMGTLSLNIKDNIGIRTNSLNVTVNGVQKEAEIINESSFNVYLTEEELKYMFTILITVNDLAGNQGRLFEIYNLDMPTGIEALAADDNTDDNTTVKVSHRQLNITGAEAHATIHVFSMNGDLVATAQADDEGCATIKLTMQPNGLYVFTISSGKSGKIVLK